MRLTNLRLLNSSATSEIILEGGKIRDIVTTGNDNIEKSISIDCKNGLAFPGLINSHDHLDFNCFSPLGNKKYANYTEWGHDIHQQYKAEIQSILAIPQELRTAWGMYKNLLAGVTTVINHGSFIAIENPLIHIEQQPQSLHSVQFEKNWKWKLNNPFKKNIPCVIHVGEGTDELSANEIDALLHWNLLNRKLVGIHGVAMNTQQAKGFSGLVWCPESNQVLLNRHADIVQLKKHTGVVFGTDSTLTGHWNIWKHLRLARMLGLTDQQLFETVGSAPSQLWKFNKGALLAGKDADIVIAKTRSGNADWDDFFSIDPADILLVIQGGKIRLMDKTIADQLNHRNVNLQHFSAIQLHGAYKLVEGDLPGLAAAIKKYYAGMEFPFEMTEKSLPAKVII